MKYLPLGSVVLTGRSTHPYMIIARQFKKPGKQEYFDYRGVPYPEGNTVPENIHCFDREDITEVLFTGYECEIEDRFQEFLLSRSNLTCQ